MKQLSGNVLLITSKCYYNLMSMKSPINDNYINNKIKITKKTLKKRKKKKKKKE